MQPSHWIFEKREIKSVFRLSLINSVIPQDDSESDFYSIFWITEKTGEIRIDGNSYALQKGSILFCAPNQWIEKDNPMPCEGYRIDFTKEFYCIEYHDSEVSCNGFLFYNVFKLPFLLINKEDEAIFKDVIKKIIIEMEQGEISREEMLKILLKMFLIHSNRLLRKKELLEDISIEEFNLYRKFSELIEKNFRTIKDVNKYAELLNMAPASLTKHLQKLGVDSPSKIIRDRVILEAKRMLIYTDKTIKEISYHLGYEDPHHFSRLFSQNTGIYPTEFKNHYFQSLK